MNATSSELYQKLSKLQWLLHRQQIKGYATGGPMADPTRGQGRILAMLKMQDGVSTKDLSYLLGIRVSSLNELLAKLEKGGYVTRESSEEDKRIILVRLTEKGRNEKQGNEELGNIFDCLSEDEQKTFGEYLERVIATLEAEVGDGADIDFDWMASARERFGGNFDRMFMMSRGGHPHGCFNPHDGFNPHDDHSHFRHDPHFKGHCKKDKDSDNENGDR